MFRSSRSIHPFLPFALLSWLIRNTYVVFQMTKIYFSYIFGLHQWFLAHTFQDSWNVLSDKSNGRIFCYIWCLVHSSWKCFRARKVKWLSCLTRPFPPQLFVNKMTFGKPLRTGTGCQRNQPWGGTLNSRERMRHWRLNQSPTASDLLNHAYVIRPS